MRIKSSLLFLPILFLGASCDTPHIFDKNIWVYYHSTDRGINLEDPTKSQPATSMEGWVCTDRNTYKIIIENFDSLDTRLKDCEKNAH